MYECGCCRTGSRVSYCVPLAGGFHLLVGKFFVSSSRDGMLDKKKSFTYVMSKYPCLDNFEHAIDVSFHFR